MGVRLARAVELHRRMVAKSMLARIELRMLSGENQELGNSPLGEGCRYRRELNGFGPGPDDRYDLGGQPSP
jgi:hypothetical protein